MRFGQCLLGTVWCSLEPAGDFVPGILGGVLDTVDDLAHYIGRASDSFTKAPEHRTSRVAQEAYRVAQALEDSVGFREDLLSAVRRINSAIPYLPLCDAGEGNFVPHGSGAMAGTA